MIRRLCSWLLYKHWGWKKHVTVEHPDKFILCVAPHTSNWDFLIGQLYMRSEGMKINFLMKKEWFFWPLGPIFRRMGGIPVYRSKHTNMTDNLAEAALQSSQFRLCITPEGTRSLNPNWKKGFYYIALKARIPVLLYALDYEKKLVECTRSFVPTGDFEKEMRETKLYYKDFKGKHPDKFTIGEI
ncbi:MAG: 1-acyl-sn-glycerol-3-phosphate acyltransferase [Prevotella sp.]|jgi:1-acyl-sn-glycerol-3-phosphate acyltransferase